MKRPFTIVEIAMESGVSIATVSRVLNGTAPVSAATRTGVNAAIEKRSYTPNGFARELSRRSISGTAQTSGRRELDSLRMMVDKNVDGVLVAGGQADLIIRGSCSAPKYL